MTVAKVRKVPRRAGTNQTMFMIGTSSAEGTIRGVTACPTTRPTGFERPRTAMANGRWPSLNQCWLTLAGTLAMNGLARPVMA